MGLVAQPNDEIMSRLERLIRHETGSNKAPLRDDHELARDFGVDGQDGVDFMHAFGVEFGVDLSAFQASDYFGPETFNPFDLLRPSWWKMRRGLLPITVRDLAGAARAGKWPQPVR